jgi:putative PEP-CTERM system histidine kinase
VKAYLGSLSYGAAAIAYAVLALLVLVAARGQTRARWVVAAAMSTIVWAGLIALWSLQETLSFASLFTVEIVRDGLWIAALASMGYAALPRKLLWTAGAIGVGFLAIAWGSPLLSDAHLARLPSSTALLSLAGLLMALIGVVMLEQLYRNSPPGIHRQLAYLTIGVGGIFAYDLVLYSQAQLKGEIDVDIWNARGIVSALLTPLIALAVRRNPQWSLQIFVSRQVVFYTGAITVIGAYLLLIALGGYYVRDFGGSWGRVGAAMFISGALVTLAFAAYSDSLRRQFRVFISKHFFRNKYDYRIEWLRFIATLSSIEETDVRLRALKAVTQIMSCPSGVLYLKEEHSRVFHAQAEWPRGGGLLSACKDVPDDAPLARFLAGRQWVVDMREHTAKPALYGGLELPVWLKGLERARIVTPLLQLNELVGFMVLWQPPEPFELIFEDRDLLKTVGRHIATQIAQHEADRRLAESRQFDALNQLTAFMMHDLKNATAQLQLIVENAERHKRNPAFVDDAIQTIANAVERISKLIEQLRSQSARSQNARMSLQEVVRAAVAHLGARNPVPTCDLSATEAFVWADADRLTSVLEHIVRNAQDACAEGGRVAISLIVAGETATLTVSDTGSGMTEVFVRERLFRPFDSTKGSKGMGIGAYQTREYVRALGGAVEVRSSPGQGTAFSLSLPLSTEPSIRGATIPPSGRDAQPIPGITS